MGLRMVPLVVVVVVVAWWWWWSVAGMRWIEAGDCCWWCPLFCWSETKVVLFCFVFEGWRWNEWGRWWDKVKGFSVLGPCDLLIFSDLFLCSCLDSLLFIYHIDYTNQIRPSTAGRFIIFPRDSFIILILN